MLGEQLAELVGCRFVLSDEYERINRSGVAYLTPAVVDGRWMVRVSIGAVATERDDVAAVWRTIRQAAEG